MSHIPQIGQLLQSLIVTVGYKPILTEDGLDKDLEHLATEQRMASHMSILSNIEEKIAGALKFDCGGVWASSLMQHWMETKFVLRDFTQTIPACFHEDKEFSEFFQSYTGELLVCKVLESFLAQPNSLNDEIWCDSPFKAWVNYCSGRTGLSCCEILENIANSLGSDTKLDSKTVNERWFRHAKPIGSIKWPIRKTVKAAAPICSSDDGLINDLSAWLLLAMAFQSCTPQFRQRIKRRFQGEEFEPELPAMANCDAIDQLDSRLEKLLNSGGSFGIIKKTLPLLKKEIGSTAPSSMFIYHHRSALFDIAKGDVSKAMSNYQKAVKGVWWKGGKTQAPILKEALLLAVGMGDQVSANRYWDQVHMLGLIKGPKQALDEQKMRQLTMSFVQHFPQLAAKRKVAPMHEHFDPAQLFELKKADIAHPNRRTKSQDGRVVRTPLMRAIKFGLLEDVKTLMEDHPDREPSKNGDPNDSIDSGSNPTGVGPFMEALWRACSLKDKEILNYLLSFELTKETVNREASTRRETPLSVAVEMGDAPLVKRLIDLGADIHVSCGGANNSLTCVLSLLMARRSGLSEIVRFMSGDRATLDVRDAKQGVVFDGELQSTRAQEFDLAFSQDPARAKAIFEESLHYTMPSEDKLVEVAGVLLESGADANSPYQLPDNPQLSWTPTLFAAEIGRLDVFDMLIIHGGDPSRMLEDGSHLMEAKDALWIANRYGNSDIVSRLKRH